MNTWHDMESVASCPPPSNNNRGLSNHSMVNMQIPPPTNVHGRFVRHGGVVMFRVDEGLEETRDDPQMSSTQRWDGETNWSPTFVDATGEIYQRSFREALSRSTHPAHSSRREQIHHSWHHDHGWYAARGCYNAAPYPSLESRQRATGGMVPISASRLEARHRHHRIHSYRFKSSDSKDASAVTSSQSHDPNDNYTSSGIIRDAGRSHVISRQHSHTRNTSIVLIPESIVIPKEISPPPPTAEPSPLGADATTSPMEHSIAVKHSSDCSDGTLSPRDAKRSKISEKDRLEGKFDKLDLLCSATLELGPLQENPTGCSCPKSKCIALYCDCFKAGRRCNPATCTCLSCKNTIAESGPNGARSKAIQSILARNPRAFTNAGSNSTANKLPPGEQACNCIRSRCLKLYCTCFQIGKTCNASTCTCVGCLNTDEDTGGHRQAAIEATLEKRPDAFVKPKVKEIGSGCACKNNRCVRKYCECFRTKLACTKKCSCRECGNQESAGEERREASSTPAPADAEIDE